MLLKSAISIPTQHRLEQCVDGCCRNAWNPVLILTQILFNDVL